MNPQHSASPWMKIQPSEVTSQEPWPCCPRSCGCEAGCIQSSGDCPDVGSVRALPPLYVGPFNPMYVMPAQFTGYPLASLPLQVGSQRGRGNQMLLRSRHRE